MLTQSSVTFTTNGSGAATAYAGSGIRGRVLAIKYEPTSIATGATIVLSGETTAVAVLTKASAGTSTVWYYPLAITNQAADGAASSISEEPVWLYKERLKIVVSSGGDTKTGTVTVYCDEEQ